MQHSVISLSQLRTFLEVAETGSVREAAERLVVSQPAVSKHLGILKAAGLVRDRPQGRQTHYSAQLGALAPLIDWTKQMTGFWQHRFDRLEDLIKRMDQ